MACPKGKIRRSSYTKKDGTRVASTCVPDKGKPGKTPKSQKILPPIKNNKYLRSSGYSTKKSKSERHKALDKVAAKSAKNNSTSLQKGYAEVEKHLNLVRNYTPKGTKVHKTMSEDMKYLKMKRLASGGYKKSRRSSKKKSSRSKKSKKSRKSRKK